MNDRGLDLSPTDILKADIIGAIDSEAEQAKYNEIWEALEDQLGREEFRDLFAHIRMIHRKQKMRGTLEREFREHVDPLTDPCGFIDDELRPSAIAFGHILRPDPRISKRFRILQGLARLDNQDWQPPAIAAFVRAAGDSAKIDAFLKGLERLAYFLFITRANINARLHRYAQVLEEIEAGGDLRALNAFSLDEDESWDLFDTLNDAIYEVPRTRKPILLKLDEILSDGTAHYEHELITIEHVLPQNPAPKSAWLKDFPDEGFREEWVHSLANLVLLSKYKNPAASNYDFDYKKTKYFTEDGDSPFVLTNQVRDTPQWNPAVLERRQYELLRKMAQHWNLTKEFENYWAD